MTSDPAERRRLVFHNLINGVPLEHVAPAFHLTADQALADFRFVRDKVRAYRFLRGMPLLESETVEQARRYQGDMLWTLERLNLGKDAEVKVKTLPYTIDPSGRPSEAEAVMFEKRLRAGSKVI